MILPVVLQSMLDVQEMEGAGSAAREEGQVERPGVEAGLERLAILGMTGGEAGAGGAAAAAGGPAVCPAAEVA